MLNVILTIHMIACIALVIAVMLQRSEGGALGMSGGGTGGVISGRGAANALVRVTMILAGIFFVTSIVMTRLNNEAAQAPSTLERQSEETADPFDSLRNTPVEPGAPDALGGGATTPAPADPAPAPTTTPDPLAPATTPPAATSPATTAPTTPTPAPENGGSPN
jgi:preprotein translocase subunit SecG